MKCPKCGKDWPDNYKGCPLCLVPFYAEMSEGASIVIPQGKRDRAAEERVAYAVNGSVINSDGDIAVDGNPALTGDGNVIGDYSSAEVHKETYNGPVATGPGGRAIQAKTYVEVLDPAQREADKARTRYLKHLSQRCNVLPIAALGAEEGMGDEVTLDQVYVALDTKTKVPLSEEEKQQRQSDFGLPVREDNRPLTAMEAAIQNRHLVLLGDPGSGKSTFARQVTARLAAVQLGKGKTEPGWEPDLVPLFVSLRELSSSLTQVNLEDLSEEAASEKLVKVVRQHLSALLAEAKAEAWDNNLEDALRDGKVVLFLDGLDEVGEAYRDGVRKAVGALLRSYPLKRVVVTCRARSYTGSAVLPGFAAHTLAPFDAHRIKNFVEAWYLAQVELNRVERAHAQERMADLQHAVLGAELQELASNPMLLTTMAIVHQREVGLPRERVRLYSLAVQVLLDRWQKRKGMEVSDSLAALLGDDLKLRAVIERVAYEVHQRQAHWSKGSDLQRGELLELLEEPSYLGNASLAADFLDYVDQRAGLLIGQGGNDTVKHPQTYTFPHRTFQEYLAGCYLVGQRGRARSYWRRAGEGDFWHLAAQLGAEELLYNRRSDKELLDLAYELSPEAAPANEAAWRATLWSGEMAAHLNCEMIDRDTERPDGGHAYIKRLIPRLVAILRGTPLGAIERAEAGNALAKLGDPRFRADAWFLPNEPLLGFVEIPQGAFLMGSDSKHDKEAYDDEQPRHEVQLPRYYIARYPVTVAQFRAFVEAGGYRKSGYWVEAAQAGVWSSGKVKAWDDDQLRDAPYDFGIFFGLTNHPVVGITWYEALAYCRWMTEQLRAWKEMPEPLSGLLRRGGWKVQLPSEAQWEKAARGTDGRVYPWGSEIDPNLANYDTTGIGATSTVGCFRGGVSPYGVEDLSGNVWEWCCTKWEGSYKNYRDDNRLDRNGSRITRGGAFFNIERHVRCAMRGKGSPDYRSGRDGFRLVLSPPL